MIRPPLRTAGSLSGLILALVVPAVVRGQAELLKPPSAPPPPAAYSPPSNPGLRVPGGIVAIVGDEVITEADLTLRVTQRRAQLAELFPASVVEREIARLAWVTLDQMIADKLILRLVRKTEQKSNEGRPFVTEAEVDYQVERQVERLREKNPAVKTADDLYRVAREVEGLSRSEYRQFLKERIEVEMYLRQFVLKGTDSYVSPEEARTYYLTHLDEFTVPVEVAFRQVLIPVNREDALARREALEKGLKEGEPFLELARKYSQEAIDGNLESAGYLFQKSFQQLESWHKPIPDILRTLKEGQVSEPVFTVQGIHYFFMERVVPGEPKSFAEVQGEIRRKRRIGRENDAIREFVDRLRQRAFVRVFLKRPQEEGPAEPAGSEERAEVSAAERISPREDPSGAGSGAGK